MHAVRAWRLPDRRFQRWPDRPRGCWRRRRRRRRRWIDRCRRRSRSSADEPALSSTARTRRSFVEAVRNERLPTEARVDRHHEHEVHVRCDRLERGRGRPRVDHHASLCTELANERDRAIQMPDGFDVDGHHAGARGDELLDVAIRVLDHQVHVERPCGDASDRAHHRRTDRDVRDEVPVHHVDVNQVRAATFGRRDIASERCEVGGQNRRRNLDRARSHRLTSSEMASLAPTRNPPAGCCRTTVPGGTPG